MQEDSPPRFPSAQPTSSPAQTSPLSSLRPTQSRSRASSPRRNHQGPMAAWRRPESQETSPRRDGSAELFRPHDMTSTQGSHYLQDSSVFGDSLCFGNTHQGSEFAPGQLQELLDNSSDTLTPSMTAAMPALQPVYNTTAFSSDDEAALDHSHASFADSAWPGLFVWHIEGEGCTRVHLHLA